MKDENFLKESNARHMWHPMAHPADSLADPPKIITGGRGVRIVDVDGAETIDAVGRPVERQPRLFLRAGDGGDR